MFATIIGNRVYVSLSRSNLRQLDAILHNPDSRNRCLTRRAENGVSLVVQVEDDADHYEGRDPEAGSVNDRQHSKPAESVWALWGFRRTPRVVGPGRRTGSGA